MGEERLILPPPVHRRRESEILNEIPNVLGLVLWQDVRHLHAWADTCEALRPPADIFNPSPPTWVLAKRRDARAQCGELSAALGALQAVAAAPRSVDRTGVAHACREVVDWALAHEHTQTAIEFAEAAARVDPKNPEMANLAGRVTRNAGDYARAEVWFNRGIGYSRVRKNTIELTRAHLGRGILCQELGRVRCAERHFNIGSRKARKQGIEWLAAEVQHDLTLLLTIRGRYAAAEKHARLALQWYGKRHERFPLFAADVALLMVLECNYPLAARIAKGALHHVTTPAARSVILSLHARALAGCGRADEVDRIRRRVLRILQDHREKEPAALWHLAAADRLEGRWDAAAAIAQRSLELARARGDLETARLSQGLLCAVQERKPVPQRNPLRRDSGFAAFIQTLADRLSTWSPEQRSHSELRTKWAA